jgi:hypothetical protein
LRSSWPPPLRLHRRHSGACWSWKGWTLTYGKALMLSSMLMNYGKNGITTPDALQMATALHAGG